MPVNLLLMANTIQLMDPGNLIQKVYDLKGSYINRLVAPGENQTMKDRNLIACSKERLRTKTQGLL